MRNVVSSDVPIIGVGRGRWRFAPADRRGEHRQPVLSRWSAPSGSLAVTEPTKELTPMIMSNLDIIISDASIAGPATAFWLNRYGRTTTMVEQASQLRTGGQAVDFRGAQVEVLCRMGLLDEIRRNKTGMGEQRIFDADGRHVLTVRR
jgi:hypothetical protein